MVRVPKDIGRTITYNVGLELILHFLIKILVLIKDHFTFGY